MQNMAKKDFYDIKGLGEIPAEGEAAHPAPPHQPPRPYKSPKHKKMWRPILIAVLIIIILAAAGGGTYWLTKHHKATPKKSTTTQATIVKPTSNTSTSGTQQYVSNGSDLNLSFTYPSTWTVTPASGGNSSDQTITLTSPLTSIPAAGGASVTGKVVVTIRPGTTTPSELNSNTPTEAVASSQFAYTTPTANQYQYPYLSFIHFSTGAPTAGAFEEVIITGTTQFTQGQAVSAALLTGLDPIISATFSKCATTACTSTGAVPLSITSATWTNTALFQQVQSIFASMKLN